MVDIFIEVRIERYANETNKDRSNSFAFFMKVTSMTKARFEKKN